MVARHRHAWGLLEGSVREGHYPSVGLLSPQRFGFGPEGFGFRLKGFGFGAEGFGFGPTRFGFWTAGLGAESDPRHGGDQGLVHVLDGLDEMGLAEDQVGRLWLVDLDR